MNALSNDFNLLGAESRAFLEQEHSLRIGGRRVPSAGDRRVALVDPSSGSVVGHVHLRVGRPEDAEAWWRQEFGFDTVAKYGSQAVFLSSGGYHHHIGANTWQSAGAGRRDPARSGLAWVEMRSDNVKAEQTREDPWGTVIRTVPGKA